MLYCVCILDFSANELQVCPTAVYVLNDLTLAAAICDHQIVRLALFLFASFLHFSRCATCMQVLALKMKCFTNTYILFICSGYYSTFVSVTLHLCSLRVHYRLISGAHFMFFEF